MSPGQRPSDGSDNASTDASELRALIGSARELLVECVEEGIDQFDKLDKLDKLDNLAVAPQNPPQPDRSIDAARTARPATPPAESAAANAGEPAPTTRERPTLEQVRQELGDCTRCELCSGRKNIVFGSGNPNADLMFVGEGPGQQEDEQGLPFVGRAGELLTKMIEKGLQISRSEVYICNIVKCRPPNNRNPLPPEVSACQPFLDGQIDAVNPKVIVTLGKPAASLLLGREVAITRMRGTWQSYRGIPLMPTLHPAFILRQYTPENRRLVWEDLQAALAKAREDD